MDGFASTQSFLNSQSALKGNSTAAVEESGGSHGELYLLISILLYNSFSAVGVMILPWTLISELYPIQVSNIATVIAMHSLVDVELIILRRKLFLFIAYEITLAFTHSVSCDFDDPTLQHHLLFYLQVKGKLGGITVTIAYAFMFGAVKTFPYLLNQYSMEMVFYLFALSSLAFCVFVYKFLPETFGKSLL